MVFRVPTRILVCLVGSILLMRLEAVAKEDKKVHLRWRRHVPQEWAHAAIVNTVDKFLKMNNPQEIVHPIFTLLGAKAAANGTGKFDIKNFDCFQKMVADQAFTNAKKEKSLEGQEAAIIFAALEKNTPGVGLASPPCKSLQAKNPEINRLIQHQDAGSPGAAEINKKASLLVAESLKEIGSEPKLAIQSGTFRAAKMPEENNNAKGITCDNDKDPKGCIFSENKLNPDVTEEEIKTYLASLKQK